MATRREWRNGHLERVGSCQITFHADYGRGHYQVRCAGKGHVGSPKSLAKARKLARSKSNGTSGLAGRRRRR